jgi:hypothetical protein
MTRQQRDDNEHKRHRTALITAADKTPFQESNSLKKNNLFVGVL